MSNLKVLIVGGTFSTERNEKPNAGYSTLHESDGGDIVMTHEYGTCSGLVAKVFEAMKQYTSNIMCYNGGRYDHLATILDEAGNYDIVFWWPNVDNNLPKIRDIKAKHPNIMLITSKRNINEKYNFGELVQRALMSKSNLVFEFSNIPPIVTPVLNGKMYYKIKVFDPLGCVWADTTDVEEAVCKAMERLLYLKSITRQQTIQSDTDKSLVLKWYFDQFKLDDKQADGKIPECNNTDLDTFVEIVKFYAHKFQELMPDGCKTERFVGNASIKPKFPQVGRCGKGMPSFKHDGMVWVSKRNVDKQFIDRDCFVPVYLEDGKLYYYGEDKPSVDSPVQIRLYDALPNIRYMLHSHCYLQTADVTTTKAIPCGAIEEVDEILSCIDDQIGDRTKTEYTINILGHGSIVMCADLLGFDDLLYVERQLPEKMF